MKKLMNLILAISFLLVLAVRYSHAETPISISYRLLDMISAQATDVFILELEVSNTGSVDLTGVVIAPVSHLAGGIQGKAEIASIPAAQTVKKVITVTAPKGLLDVDGLPFEVIYSNGNAASKTVVPGVRKG